MGADRRRLARLQSVRFGSAGTPAPTAETPAFYTKDGEQTQMPPMQPGQYFVTYQALHDSSLQQREQGVEGAMKPMYSFWANFLVDKFNDGMYNEFKTLAESDAKEGDLVGQQHLTSYFQGALKSSAALSERVALDMVAMLREEKDNSRAMFKMMRLAWRDGSLNLKTRKRIGDILSGEEKAEFDKGG
jgi:la-related protein 1